jgi:hypothetical protein
MADQQYEVFDEAAPTACSARLPVQVARDRFDFIQFVPLVERYELEEGGAGETFVASSAPAYAVMTQETLTRLSAPVRRSFAAPSRSPERGSPP